MESKRVFSRGSTEYSIFLRILIAWHPTNTYRNTFWLPYIHGFFLSSNPQTFQRSTNPLRGQLAFSFRHFCWCSLKKLTWLMIQNFDNFRGKKILHASTGCLKDPPEVVGNFHKFPSHIGGVPHNIWSPFHFEWNNIRYKLTNGVYFGWCFGGCFVHMSYIM